MEHDYRQRHRAEQLSLGLGYFSIGITHRMTLDAASRGFDIFNRKQEECLKIVLKTH